MPEERKNSATRTYTADELADELLGAAEVAEELLGTTKRRLGQLMDQPDFPEPVARLKAGPVWLKSSFEAYGATWPRKRGRLPAGWREAEDFAVAKLNDLHGWVAVNVNTVTHGQPGYDVLVSHSDGRSLRCSVKSISSMSGRCDFGVGKSLDPQRCDFYVFVNQTTEPWEVYVAGVEPVLELAKKRHEEYNARRGRGPELNSWSPKISRELLRAMGAQDNWRLLDSPDPRRTPQVTKDLREHARRDAPRPRGG
jgi:hypothetical protein